MSSLKSNKLFLIILNGLIILSCNQKKSDTYSINPSIIYFSISKGSNFDTTVYIRNYDSKKLFISEIATTCGCTVGTIKDSSILSNDSIPLKLIFKPDSLESGKVNRFISIRTSGNPSIKTIELRGNIL